MMCAAFNVEFKKEFYDEKVNVLLGENCNALWSACSFDKSFSTVIIRGKDNKIYVLIRDNENSDSKTFICEREYLKRMLFSKFLTTLESLLCRSSIQVIFHNNAELCYDFYCSISYDTNPNDDVIEMYCDIRKSTNAEMQLCLKLSKTRFAILFAFLSHILSPVIESFYSA